jgi:DNA-binding transcriptional LysR family regulator
VDRFAAMSTLLAVVEAGSLSAGARGLGMPLATVSRRMAELEVHLGTRLFHRTSRRIALTEAGRSYALACRRILEELSEAERTASGEYVAPRGELIVTAPVVFGRLHVLPVLVGFLQAYPEIDVRLILADRVIDLFDDQVDVAVRIAALPDSSLVATGLGTIRRIVCASPAYLAERGTPERPNDLAGHDCIAFAGLTPANLWTFQVGPAAEEVQVCSRLVVTTAEAAVDAALAGVGLTRVLSYQAEQAVRAGALTVVLEAFEPPPSPVQLVHRGGRILPLKLRAFLDFTTPRLRHALAEVGEMGAST